MAPRRSILLTALLALAALLASARVSADPGHPEGAASADEARGRPSSPDPRAPHDREGLDVAVELDGVDDEAREADATSVRPPSSRRALRWSDGPRRVPTPRGASKSRAEALGLGTRLSASHLLHARPDEAWIRAARGRTPERLLWPIDAGRWVRGFGYVRTTRPDLIHRGVDIAAPAGSVVRAAADGIVAYSDNGVHGYGNVVMIVHPNGWMTLYAHNARTTVQPGYRVRRGERIAIVGTTGITHGPHVHFELWREGRAVDPSALFDGGPPFVERLGARAARRGEVPPPRPVTAADRPDEPALAPHPDDAQRPRPEGRAARRARDVARAEGERSSRRGARS